jgi:hypothetical protein
MPVRLENLRAATTIALRVNELRAGAKSVPKLAAGTLARRLPVFAKRDMSAQYNLSAARIGKALRCKADDSSVTLTAIGRPIGLSDFGAKQNRQGVQVAIERGAAQTISHAFVRTPRGDISATGPQVYVRDAAFNSARGSFPEGVQDTAFVSRDTHGYPIVRLAGPSVADMLRDGDREDRLVDFAQSEFATEVDRLQDAFHGK